MRNTGPAVCQLKYNCRNRSTLFQVPDNYPGMTRKWMRVLVKCVKVCQDKCGALSDVEHRQKPAWLLRMWIWITWCMYKQVWVVCANVIMCLELHFHVLLSQLIQPPLKFFHSNVIVHYPYPILFHHSCTNIWTHVFAWTESINCTLRLAKHIHQRFLRVNKNTPKLFKQDGLFFLAKIFILNCL